MWANRRTWPTGCGASASAPLDPVQRGTWLAGVSHFFALDNVSRTACCACVGGRPRQSRKRTPLKDKCCLATSVGIVNCRLSTTSSTGRCLKRTGGTSWIATPCPSRNHACTGAAIRSWINGCVIRRGPVTRVVRRGWMHWHHPIGDDQCGVANANNMLDLLSAF